MEDSGIVTASDIVWFMVSNTESAEQETTDWTFSESLILLSFCFIYVRRCHLFQPKWHLLLSLEHIKRYCWYQGNTARIYHVHLYFLVSFLNRETVLLGALSEKVFWDAIFKFILITKLLYANSMHYRMPAVICCKRNENTRILVITSKK